MPVVKPILAQLKPSKLWHFARLNRSASLVMLELNLGRIGSVPSFYIFESNFDKIEVFGVPGVKEIEKNEFQAVYRENLIRQELNMPLRTHYITNETTDGTFIKGLGPNMLDSSGKPKRPSWY